MAAHDASACLIFGYGSIINDESRAGTTGGGELVAAARLLPGVGWTRCWNFRSATGFTALGLRRAAPGDEDAGMNGVLFQARAEAWLCACRRGRHGGRGSQIRQKRSRFCRSFSSLAKV